MDIFRDYFTRETLLASIAKAPYTPGRLGDLFESRGITTTKLSLESTPKNAGTVLTSVPRGQPAKIETLEKREVYDFDTKHYRDDGAVYADEVLNLRGAGIASAVEVISTRRDELMARMRRTLDLTHESLRMTCLLTPSNAFGNLAAEQTIAFNTDATKTRAEIFNKIIKPMETALDGIPFSGIRVFCEDALWAKLIENAAIKATLLNYQAALTLRNDPREQVYFGGVTFERYRGTGSVNLTSGKARAIPEGVPGMFLQAFAPADTMDTVGAGAMGAPYYAQAMLSPDNRRWYMELQTNCVMVCTRPSAVLAIATD